MPCVADMMDWQSSRASVVWYSSGNDSYSSSADADTTCAALRSSCASNAVVNSCDSRAASATIACSFAVCAARCAGSDTQNATEKQRTDTRRAFIRDIGHTTSDKYTQFLRTADASAANDTVSTRPPVTK